MKYQADIVIIGAGIVGLAIASEITSEKRQVFVLEKNDSFGLETSSRNSQVIHSGIYYPQGSLKAKTCVEGRAILYDLCKKYNLSHKQVGKLIVAVDDSEIEQLEALLDKGKKNGVDDLRLLTRDEVKQLETNISAVAALFSPSTGIIDAHALMNYFVAEIKNRGGSIIYRSKVTGIDRENGGYKVSVEDGSGESKLTARTVINSAGLNSDKVAEMAGINIAASGYKLHYCKGEYFKVSRDKSKLVKRLIYPVPEVAGTGLGIHTTPTFDGVMLLGPSSRYIDSLDYSVDEQIKGDFYNSVSRFLPFLECEDLEPEMAGIRPTLQGPGDGVKDFVIKDEKDRGLPGFINLVGIESPGLTASPAIAKYVSGIVDEALSN
ncbi:NAD(P)/FAD-dependent oxidoreductase [Chloroflexota bacterium]